MRSIFGNKSGMSLIELVVAVAVGLASTYMISSHFSRMGKVEKKVGLRGEVEKVRQTIRAGLSCLATTGSEGSEPFAACDPAGTPYVLKSKRVTTASGAVVGGVDLFPLEADGSIKATSGFKIRASCSDPARGIIVEYKRERNAKTLNDQQAGLAAPTDPGWRKLFPDEGGGGLCRSSFSHVGSDSCAEGEVAVGFTSEFQPICRNVYDRAQFQVCFQFSDHNCSSQVGRTECSPCTSLLSAGAMAAPAASVISPWASDNNLHDPDCAKVIIRRCNLPPGVSQPALPPGSTGGVFSPSIQTVSGGGGANCQATCGGDEIMVGFTFKETGNTGSFPPGVAGPVPGTASIKLNCSASCMSSDIPVASRNPTAAAGAPVGTPCPPPVPTPTPEAYTCPSSPLSNLQWVNAALENRNKTVCHNACLNRLKAAKTYLEGVRNDKTALGMNPGPVPNVPPPDTFNNEAISYQRGLVVFQKLRAYGKGIGCPPFPAGIPYHEP